MEDDVIGSTPLDVLSTYYVVEQLGQCWQA